MWELQGWSLPPRLGPSLAPSCQGQWDESRFWGGLSTKCYVWKAIIRDSLHIQSFLMSPGPRPEWASCVFDNNRPSITSGQQPTTATGPPSYKLNFDKRLTRGRVAWENYSPIWNWSPIILSAGAFRLGLSEDTTDRRQLSVLDWNWRGVTSTGRRPSSLSAVGYLTAANELLPTQELHQAAAPGPRSLLSLVTGSEQVLLASLPVSGCQTTMPVNLRIHWGNQTWKERAGDWWCLKTTALIPLGF